MLVLMHQIHSKVLKCSLPVVSTCTIVVRCVWKQQKVINGEKKEYLFETANFFVSCWEMNFIFCLFYYVEDVKSAFCSNCNE